MIGEQQQQRNNEFNNNFPAIDLPTKNYSLEADMVSGWRPKIKVLGPIPFNFDSRVLDEIIDELTSFGMKYKERVIFMGNRFISSFKMHQEMNHAYRFKHESTLFGSFSHMNAYFKKFHAHFKSKNSGRIFKGMNPTIKTGDQVVFESGFESGNLDVAIKVAEDQYDVFMRVDTNTRGHVQWFNFTVKNFEKKKIRINIVNFKKNNTLHSRDMRPYIFSENIKQTKGWGWHQGGQNVKYQKTKLRYSFLQDIFMQETITYNCLKFDYAFENGWEVVQFAYCAPFTYSQTLNMITDLKSNMRKETPNKQNYYIQEETLCQSLGGLDLPLLTITDKEIQNKYKRCVLLSARIHPGETCGSYMMKGFLEFICSNDENAQALRRMAVFKVVPMLNPDGVVVGNFRTSLGGKDLNRQFRTSADLLIPEVKALKQLVIKLKEEYRSRLVFFLDFHGHSVKKNVFLYGPDYEIWETNYYKSRIFPKIMASKTQIFRYYSCIFRIADFKRSTARAVLLNTIPHCFTIEASTAFYYSQQEKKDIAFTPQSWGFMGKVIGESIKQYMELMYDQDMTREERKQKLNELKTNKVKSKQPKFDKTQNRNGSFQTRLISVSSSHKNKNQDDLREDNNEFSQKVKDIIEQIKREEKMKKQNKNEEEQQGHQSDKYSEGGSDSQGESDDIPEEQLKLLHEQILVSVKQFKNNFYNKTERNQRQYSLKQTKNPSISNQHKISVKLKPPRQSKGIEMIPSLRKKAEKIPQVVHWPKIKGQDQRSLTSNIHHSESPHRERTKIDFKSYLEHIQKQKNGKKASTYQLQIQGRAEFRDNFSRS